MKSRITLTIALFFCGALGALAQAPVSFTTGVFTNNSVLSMAGSPSQEIYGVTFGDSSTRITANGYTFGSSRYNNNTNVNYVGSPNTSFLSGGGTSGDGAFDGVLGSAAVGGGATGALTLNNLTVNATYNVLFLVADTRTGMGQRSFTVSSGSAASAARFYAFAGGTPSLGGYVLATFTASAPTQTFQILPGSYGYQLNGLLVYRISGSDTVLEPVITDNLPVFTSLTAYDYVDDSTTMDPGDPTVPYDQTLYFPFDSTTYQWWDNLVGEEIQARLPVVMFATRGAYSNDPANPLYASGDMNPRELTQMVAAMQRAGVTNQIQLACFVDSPFMLLLSNSQLGVASSTMVDLSNQSLWNSAWWLGGIKPWFDTVPSQYWYRVNGRPVIQLWGGVYGRASNINGNASALFSYITAQFQATYGVSPVFILDTQWQSQDPTVLNLSNVIGINDWYSSPSRAYSYPLNYPLPSNYVSGCEVAGSFIYVPGSINHNNPNAVIPRNGLTGTGHNGDTLIAGMEAAYANNADLTVMEGWNDVREFAGLYRSTSPRWDFPNQYINIIGRYSDLRTTTRRLEAEACDEYGGSPGNPSGAYRRTGTLGIRGLGGVGNATSNVVSAAGQGAARAFDGNVVSKWFTGQNPSSSAPLWLQYNYGYGSEHGTGNNAVVTAYTLTSANVQACDPKSWQFQASNDGNTWATLDTQSGQVFTAHPQARTFNILNASAYQYYRLSITAAYGSSTGTSVAEMSFTTSSTRQSSGWFVCDTVANEWIQFDQVNFSAGNYKFPVRYASTVPHTLQLYIDGVALPAVVVPSTGDINTFQTAYLGVKALTHGTHNLKIMFVDGGVDLDWLFVKKYDPMIGFKSVATGCYLTASGGGGDTLVSTQATQDTWESFSVDDQLGAGTVNNTDSVNIQTYDGLYVSANSGGGSSLHATVRVPNTWERFTVVKVGGSGTLGTGDKVALRCYDGVHYITVQSNGTVDATGTAIGAPQTFTVNLSSQ